MKGYIINLNYKKFLGINKMKYIPPILISILAFLWGLRLFSEYNKIVGIVTMFLYLFLVFGLNMLIPIFLKKITTIKTRKSYRTFFLTFSIAIFAIGIIVRYAFTKNWSLKAIYHCDTLLMVVFALSCGNYNFFTTLDTQIKDEQKKIA